ncbi:hypothetical protein TELCIR_02610 [Teladorsagia circumcincta]|uniref:Uncharacterized protein n=1 Tax=Teladorsagia circumcincta TaxID=45464 RepID=A0A2G9UYZ1_TELCI|nr:hypothetical protein TELCIR_02610 [Teladorsagia circumcincta]
MDTFSKKQLRSGVWRLQRKSWIWETRRTLDWAKQCGNAAEERLVNFCDLFYMYHGSSHFKKTPAKRWTYMSPNGQHYHELDHVLCNRKAITDVEVVPLFDTENDHNLLHAKLDFDRSLVRLSQIQSTQPQATTLDEL